MTPTMARFKILVVLCFWSVSKEAQAWVSKTPFSTPSTRQLRRQCNQLPLPLNAATATTSTRYQSVAIDRAFTIATSPSYALAASSTSLSSSTTAQEPLERLSLYNSKTRSKDVLQPEIAGKISMYTCGPTVYDFAHVGNFRAFLTYDVMKRVLLYLGYDVTHVCNLTDVDDKIIQRANEQKLTDVSELTLQFEGLFKADLEALNIVPADKYPRATQHIPEMMEMILELADKGLAYETPDGSWYFATQKQAGYGKQLVQLQYDDMEQTERSDSDGKQHFADFCMWKSFKEGFDRDDMAWSSDRIQRGRPGWHLECSAMARKYFGDNTIDLHGGGVDLKFPHHENEIAQSEGCMDGRTFCNCWFHNGFVNLDNEKMSKSLGNFLTLRTACPNPDDVRAYRYLVVSSQYRNPLAFTPEAMQGAKNVIKRVDKVKAEVEKALSESKVDGAVALTDAACELVESVVPKAMDNFKAAIQDDLSMPRAAASLFALIKAAEGEFKRVAKEDDGAAALDLVGLKAILEAMKNMDRIFGIFYQVPVGEGEEQEDVGGDSPLEVSTEVMDLVSQRSAAKDAKDWGLADSLRKQIAELGYAVKDVKDGEPIVSRTE
jgi:cysteinyl-tRNA synthetase